MEDLYENVKIQTKESLTNVDNELNIETMTKRDSIISLILIFLAIFSFIVIGWKTKTTSVYTIENQFNNKQTRMRFIDAHYELDPLSKKNLFIEYYLYVFRHNTSVGQGGYNFFELIYSKLSENGVNNKTKHALNISFDFLPDSKISKGVLIYRTRNIDSHSIALNVHTWSFDNLTFSGIMGYGITGNEEVINFMAYYRLIFSIFFTAAITILVFCRVSKKIITIQKEQIITLILLVLLIILDNPFYQSFIENINDYSYYVASIIEAFYLSAGCLAVMLMFTFEKNSGRDLTADMFLFPFVIFVACCAAISAYMKLSVDIMLLTEKNYEIELPNILFMQKYSLAIIAILIIAILVYDVYCVLETDSLSIPKIIFYFVTVFFLLLSIIFNIDIFGPIHNDWLLRLSFENAFGLVLIIMFWPGLKESRWAMFDGAETESLLSNPKSTPIMDDNLD